MAGPPPEGQPAPDDGRLPDAALELLGQRRLGSYAPGPFCAPRCGSCDFNPYPPAELTGSGPSDGESWLDAALAEIALAGTVLGAAPAGLPRVETVFVGGGTPTLLPPGHLAR